MSGVTPGREQTDFNEIKLFFSLSNDQSLTFCQVSGDTDIIIIVLIIQ